MPGPCVIDTRLFDGSAAAWRETNPMGDIDDAGDG